MDCLFLPPGCGADLAAGMQLYWLPANASAGRYLEFSDCATALTGRPQALVLPVECCSSYAVSLPTEKARWLRKALPYAMEELLAEDVEQMHLALGERMEDGRHRVLAVKSETLGAWLEQLSGQGVRVEVIYQDADLLPRKNIQLLVTAGRILIGGAGEVRMACLLENWSSLATDCSAPVHAYGDSPEELLAATDYHVLECPYRMLAEGRNEAVDLAQGAFALRSSYGVGFLKPISALAAFWLVLQLTFNFVQGWQLRSHGDLYAAANRELYQQLFPEERRIVNLRAQFDEHLRRSESPQGEAGLMWMLDQVATAIDKAAAIKMQQFEYREEGGELGMQVDADEFSSLEKFRDHLLRAGVGVRIASASRQKSGISAQVVVTRL